MAAGVTSTAGAGVALGLLLLVGGGLAAVLLTQRSGGAHAWPREPGRTRMIWLAAAPLALLIVVLAMVALVDRGPPSGRPDASAGPSGATEPDPAVPSATLPATAQTPGPTAGPSGVGAPPGQVTPPTSTSTSPPGPPPPPPPARCDTLSNGTDHAIPDLGTAASPVTASGCTGRASATSHLHLRLQHSLPSDLTIDLVAPDGTGYRLKNAGSGSGTGMDTTYTINLSTEDRNATWTLRIQDTAAQHSGVLDTWTLSLSG